jgi:CO/xanthine dehydrogenase Mo-binding subunit
LAQRAETIFASMTGNGANAPMARSFQRLFTRLVTPGEGQEDTRRVLLALAARKAGRPVKWVESRLEHLVAATSATNRVTTLSAAVDKDGTVTALDWDQLEDCGAYLRAPEPATLYRMHGNMTGAYRVRHLTIHNRVVLTNKTPDERAARIGGARAEPRQKNAQSAGRPHPSSALRSETLSGPDPRLAAKVGRRAESA